MNVIGLGIMKQIFNRIRDRLENTKLNGTIVTAVIGGVVVGTISWVLPLTIGDGNMAFAPIIKLTFQQVQSYTMDDVPGGMMTAHLLICSMFAKMFSLGVSMNCGFVGGFVFPMLTIGCMAGGAAALTYIDQPPGFCIACFMTAVPAGICPMPFTLLGIGVYCFFFGLYQTVPIYIAIMTSYVVVCGSGIFRKLADRGDAAAALRAQQKGEVDKNEEDTIVNNPINDSLNSSISADSIYSKPKRPVAPRNDGLVSDV